MRTKSLNPKATAWVVSAGSSEGKVALQIALAVINGMKDCRVRVLFDFLIQEASSLVSPPRLLAIFILGH